MQRAWHGAWRRTFLVTFLASLLYAFLTYWQGGISLGAFALDLGLLALSLFGGTWFFARFLLPQGNTARRQLMGEVLRSLLSIRPSAIFVQKGEAADSGERRPRLLLLDSASAAVLEKEGAFSRAVGPGLSFTRAGESLTSTLDLRTQLRAIGPHPQENPFAKQGKWEEDASYLARQARRQATSALTRDSVEIAPRIEIDFRVEGSGEDGREFNPEFVWRAIAHESVDPSAPSDARTRRKRWDWLPGHLAADLWREYLRRVRFGELFELRPDNRLSEIEFIEEMMRARLCEAIVPKVDESTQLTGRQQSSEEYALLRSRGVRVLDLHIREVHLRPEKDEEKLLEYWGDTWSERADAAKISQRAKGIEKRREGQRKAAEEFLQQVSGPLYQRLKATDGQKRRPPDGAESLDLLVRATLEAASRQPGIDRSLRESLLTQLDALYAVRQGNA